MESMTRSILRNKVAGPMKRRAVKGYLVHRCAFSAFKASPACGHTLISLHTSVFGRYQWLK